MEVPPLLVQLLGGNVVTAACVLSCVDTTDATVLRRLHPAIAVAVAEVPWADTGTVVQDTVRWRAALPAATALKLAAEATLRRGKTLAALEGVAVLDLAECKSVATDDVIARLPPTLRKLNVSECWELTQHATFTHLPALEWLDCSNTAAVEAELTCLPPSLRELHMHLCMLPSTADFSHLCNLRVLKCGRGSNALSTVSAASLPPSLEVLDLGRAYTLSTNIWPAWSTAHLIRLRVFNASGTKFDDAALAKLPPSLHELDLHNCDELTTATSFAHLTCLHTLNLCETPISSATLATLPPSLVSLNLQSSSMFTPATVLPNLPALRVLDMSSTSFGDAAVASMPAGLEELSMAGCGNVTRRACLDHLVALQVLQCVDTALARATIAACRARGCFAPADGNLSLKGTGAWLAESLVPLPDGRLVTGQHYGRVALWKAPVGRNAVLAVLNLPATHVHALVVLPDGHRVAVGTSKGIVVWDTRNAQRDKGAVSHASIACDSAVQKLAVAHNGRLVAGCKDGKLRVVDAEAGVVVATLAAHDSEVTAVVGLLDGRVASASAGGELKLCNVSRKTRYSTLTGHTESVSSLAVLPDGRLASGSWDGTVRLWDVSRGSCIRVLAKQTDHSVRALTALPDGQLVSVSDDGTIRMWDTRDNAGARVPLVLEYLSTPRSPPASLAPLPGNRLASGSGGAGVYLWQLPPHNTASP